MNDKKELQRSLNPMHVWAIAFGCIIGWGSFVNPGKKFLPNSGVAGTAIAMILGALVMIIMTNAPRIIAIAVPATPEFGRNFLPGFTKLPHPITHPKAIAHTCMGLRERCNSFLSFIRFYVTHHRSYRLPSTL